MEVRTLLPLTILQATLPEMTIARLSGSCLKDPLRMAGHRIPVGTTIQAAILIGRTDQTQNHSPHLLVWLK